MTLELRGKMVMPSERALRAALLAPEHVNPRASDVDHCNGDIVAVARDLKERIGVLQILDGTAPEWPGIHSCTEVLVELAQDLSRQLSASRERSAQEKVVLHARDGEILGLKEQLAESVNALEAAEADNSEMSEQCKQLTDRLEACQEKLEQQHSKHEAKVRALPKRSQLAVTPSFRRLLQMLHIPVLPMPETGIEHLEWS